MNCPRMPAGWVLLMAPGEGTRPPLTGGTDRRYRRLARNSRRMYQNISATEANSSRAAAT